MPDSLMSAQRPIRKAVPRTGERSRTYAIPCSAGFRDQVTELAQQRGVSIADLARAILLTVPEATVNAAPDPGEPPAHEREEVTLLSGASKGRVLRRKPRLQVRLQPGLAVVQLRRALGLAVAMARGDHVVALEAPTAKGKQADRIKALEEELERLRLMLSAVAFEPLKDGVRTRMQALYVLGFPADAQPDARALKARYRMLAMIFHPDSPQGDTLRMGQLNAARDLLRL